MALDKIFKASDNTITITVLNKDDTPVDFDQVPGVVVYVNDERGNLIDKFSKVSKTGYGDIEEVDAENGIIRVKLEASKTKAALGEGVITVEVKLEKDDVNFEDDVKHSVSFIAEVAELVDSLTEDETDLQTPVP